MIPILYEANETEFKAMGLGPMADAKSCIVTEERNGVYELEMSYPLSGKLFHEILARRIIYAIPSPYRSAQPFRIYKITKALQGFVTVYARHLSYDLSGVPVTPFAAVSAADAMGKLQAHMAINAPFLFWTDKTTSAAMRINTPTAARSALGGIQGSVLDIYGGEYEWDVYTVKLWNKRGHDSGVAIRYGKNLTGLEQETDIGNTATGIYPFWYDNEKGLVTCTPPILYAEGKQYERVAPVDLSDKFEEMPSKEQLKAEAERYMKESGIGEPKISTEVSFINLEQMSGYENLALLEKCDLCDRVTIAYEPLGVDVEAKVVRIKTNVLEERYLTIDVGNMRANVAQTIAAQEKEIKEIPMKSDIQKAIENATSWITSGGGYMVAILDPNGNWKELVSLDNADIEKAKHVWRWNNGGFGHSSSGYNGPYTTAITQDGKIVADFITTGILSADLIKAGILNGIIIQSFRSGNEYGTKINGGKIDEIALGKKIGTISPYANWDASPDLKGIYLGIGVSEKSGGLRIYATDEDMNNGYVIAEFSCDESDRTKQKVTFYRKQDLYGERNFYGATSLYGTTNLYGQIKIRESSKGEFLGSVVKTGGQHKDVYLCGNGTKNKVAMGYQNEEDGEIYSVVEASGVWGDYHARIQGGLRITGDMAATGTKNRIVDIGDKKILMNAYETADCLFGDSGSGIFNSEGELSVELDGTFRKTIEGDYSILAYGYAGVVTVKEKNESEFLLIGQPGSRVDYEIRAKQKGYADCRMKEFKDEDKEEEGGRC